jgi:CRP-like cAMP-binding protein
MANFKVIADIELRAALAAHARGRVAYERGRFIFHQGTKSSGVYLVVSGAVRLFLESSCRTGLMERVAGPGCLLGLPATFTGNDYSLTAEAIERTELLRISRADLTRLMQQDNVSAMKLLALLSGEVRTARTEIVKTAGKGHRSATSASAR